MKFQEIILLNVPVESIMVMLSRSRKKEGWENLRDSMADPAIGLKTPIGVRELEKQVGKIRFQLLYGEGRLAAAKSLKWETIPAIVKRAKDSEVAGLFLAENLIRRPMSWEEKGRIIREELATGASIGDVARALHISTTLATKYHRVVSKIAQDVELAAFALPINDAEVLVTIPAEGQRLVIELANERGERVRDVAKVARRAVANGAQWTKAGLQDALRASDAEGKQLRESLRALRLHHSLGPANVSLLLSDPEFRAAAKREGVNIAKFSDL